MAPPPITFHACPGSFGCLSSRKRGSTPSQAFGGVCKSAVLQAWQLDLMKVRKIGSPRFLRAAYLLSGCTKKTGRWSENPLRS